MRCCDRLVATTLEDNNPVAELVRTAIAINEVVGQSYIPRGVATITRTSDLTYSVVSKDPKVAVRINGLTGRNDVAVRNSKAVLVPRRLHLLAVHQDRIQIGCLWFHTTGAWKSIRTVG